LISNNIFSVCFLFCFVSSPSEPITGSEGEPVTGPFPESAAVTGSFSVPVRGLTCG
jgi:hypothetical protein